MKLKIIIPVIIIIVIIIIVTICVSVFSTPAEKHLFEILKEMENSSYTEKDFQQESLTVDKQTIKYKIPKSAEKTREDVNSKTYSFGNTIFGGTSVEIILNKFKFDAQSVAQNNNKQIFDGSNFDDFMNSKNIIKFQIGSHTYYRTTLSPVSQTMCTPVGKNYTVMINIHTNVNYTSKNDLMGIMDFE